MAGGIDTGGGKKGKKSLDASINLTAFIDLMAVVISFLIMTAVWTQIGRLQVAQAGGPSDPSETQEESKTVPVTLLVTDKAMKLSVGQGVPEEFPFVRVGDKNKLDLAKLSAKLKEIKGSLPDQTNITLQAEDAVRYEDLVRIVDECIGAGLPNVMVQAALG